MSEFVLHVCRRGMGCIREKTQADNDALISRVFFSPDHSVLSEALRFVLKGKNVSQEIHSELIMAFFQIVSSQNYK
jgi:hypothetical protein